MKYRITKCLLAAAIVLLPALAYAQSACVILSSDIAPYREAVRGFKDDFRAKTNEIVLGKDPSSAGKVLSDINKSGCSVAVAMGSKALKFLRLRISDKPIIFAMTLSPSATGIAGRNITGVYLEPSPAATLGALKRVLPNANTVGVLYSPASAQYLGKARAAARTLGITLNPMSALSTGDAVREAPAISSKSDVVWMIPDPITSSQNAFQAMLEATLKSGVPIFALSQKHVSAGAMAALATDYVANGKQAAVLARKIARGTPASALPPEYARAYGLTINLRTAKRLGFSVPTAVVKKAVEVYR